MLDSEYRGIFTESIASLPEFEKRGKTTGKKRKKRGKLEKKVANINLGWYLV